MPLQPDTSERGLWVNSDCKRGDPEVFALIIGVSRYDHLEGAANAASETYGLKQLAVSALTAYRFFEWLRDGYALNGWPVTRVRLLLSPQKRGVGNATSNELESCDATICGNAPEATYANCKQAIENWYAEMRELPSSALGRSLFFFSGHGMEILRSHQVLLPSDYLRPRGQLNEAISTRNVMNCLPLLARVPSHVLLLDGCRNDIDKLRGRNVKGMEIIDEDLPGAVNPLFEQGVLSATASGLRAYQPKELGKLSLFGQALLDGLTARPQPPLGEAPIKLLRNGDVGTIEINNLGSYVKGRVAALIKAANESVVQVVRSEVASSDPGHPLELAEISPSHLVIPIGPNVSVSEGHFEFDTAPATKVSKRSSTRGPSESPRWPVAAVKVTRTSSWFKERYRVARKPSPPPPSSADWQQHFDRFHKIFGSEVIAYPWMKSLQVTGLSTHASADHEGIDILASAQAKKTLELHRVQIHFRVKADDPIGHVLRVTDSKHRHFCCVLPRDRISRIYQLEIDTERGDVGGAFIRLATYLSPLNSGASGKAAEAWDCLRALNATEAVRLVERSQTLAEVEAVFRHGNEVLAQKMDTPLAATVAAVILLKGNRFQLMHDWARNVANWFRWIPDGVVLWTEQCRRMATERPLEEELIRWFVNELSVRSLPFTADAFGFAANIIDDIQRNRFVTDNETRAAARALGVRFDAAMPYFRDDGTFCTYATWPDDWDPIRVLGPPGGSISSHRTTSSSKRPLSKRSAINAPSPKSPSSKDSCTTRSPSTRRSRRPTK